MLCGYLQQQEAWAKQWPGNVLPQASGQQPLQPQVALEQSQPVGKSHAAAKLQPSPRRDAESAGGFMTESFAPAASAQASYRPELYADEPADVAAPVPDSQVSQVFLLRLGGGPCQQQ